MSAIGAAGRGKSSAASVSRTIQIEACGPRAREQTDLTTEENVAAQYRAAGIAEAILKSVKKLAADRAARGRGPLTVSSLSSLDSLHIGGARSTLWTLSRLDPKPRSHWLDVGAGLGGASRHAALYWGCKVTGIDVTPEFCVVSAELTAAVGLSDRIKVVEGSALSMPFADGAFDGAFTQHAGMNIADKPALYREVHRVLKPGARFGIYDVLAGPAGGEPTYPLPWAATPKENFLVGIDAVRTMLGDAGFAIEATTDLTNYARIFYRAVRNQATETKRSRRGVNRAVGRDYDQRIANASDGVENGHCSLWEIVCRKR
jgi:MPBQ/MSBQ methyltransferase